MHKENISWNLFQLVPCIVQRLDAMSLERMDAINVMSDMVSQQTEHVTVTVTTLVSYHKGVFNKLIN